jgi:serine/threonine protein kinase
MSLRVPCDDGDDAPAGTTTRRRLITPQVPCGKPNYISPEVLRGGEPFDGFAVDLWSCGVVLFIMLVGLPPWDVARVEDPRYRTVVRQGGLERMLHSWHRPVSPWAADLLQKMFREDPSERLSLAEVMCHPWVACDDTNFVQPQAREEWRG